MKLENLKTQIIEDYVELVQNRHYKHDYAIKIIIEEVLDNPAFKDLLKESVKSFVTTITGNINAHV